MREPTYDGLQTVGTRGRHKLGAGKQQALPVARALDACRRAVILTGVSIADVPGEQERSKRYTMLPVVHARPCLRQYLRHVQQGRCTFDRQHKRERCAGAVVSVTDVRVLRQRARAARYNFEVVHTLDLGDDHCLDAMALQHNVEVFLGQLALGRRRVDAHSQLGAPFRCRLQCLQDHVLCSTLAVLRDTVLQIVH